MSIKRVYFTILPFIFSAVAAIGQTPDGWADTQAIPYSLEEYAQRRQALEALQREKQSMIDFGTNSKPTYPKLPDADLTPLRETALGLEADPAAVFQFVSQKFDHTPFFGSSKGPLRTYYDGCGSELDLALLLAALLEQCALIQGESSEIGGVTLGHGTMHIPVNEAAQWLRVKPDAVINTLILAGYPLPVLQSDGKIAVNRFWVNVSIGGVNHEIDPAFKRYIWLEPDQDLGGLEKLRAMAEFNRTSMLELAQPIASSSNLSQLTALHVANFKGYLNGLRTALAQSQEVSNRSLSAEEFFGDFFGRWERPSGTLDAPTLPTTLSYTTTSKENLGPWMSLSSIYKTTIELIHPDWSWRETLQHPNVVVTRGRVLPTSDLAASRLTMEVTGADTVPNTVPGRGPWKAALFQPSQATASEYNTWLPELGYGHLVRYGGDPEFNYKPPTLSVVLPVFPTDKAVRATVGESLVFDVNFLNRGDVNLSVGAYVDGPFKVLSSSPITRPDGQKWINVKVEFTPGMTGQVTNILNVTFHRIVPPNDPFITEGNYTWYADSGLNPFRISLRGIGLKPPGQGYHFGAVQKRPASAPKHNGSCQIFGQSNTFVVRSATFTSGTAFSLDPLNGVVGAEVQPTGILNVPLNFSSDVKGRHATNLRIVTREVNTTKDTVLLIPLEAFVIDPGRATLLLDGVDISAGTENWIDSLEQGALTLKTCLPAVSDPTQRLAISHDYVTLRAGRYAIPLDFGDSEKGGMLAAAGKRMNKIQISGLPTADKAEEELLTTLEMMGLCWYQQTNQATRLLEKFFNARQLTLFRAGVVAQEYKSNTISSNANAAGFYIDMANQRGASLSIENGSDSNKLFEAQIVIHSAMEHGVLEQMQKKIAGASSTTRMIERALAEGLKLHKANHAELAALRSNTTALKNYPAPLLDSWQITLQKSALSWLLLPADGKVTVIDSTAAGLWKGYGAMLRVIQNGSDPQEWRNSAAMLISGGYNGGYAATMTQAEAALLLQAAETALQINQATAPQPSSTEPINLVTGEYYYDRTDVSIGQAVPQGVAFARHYTSAGVGSSGALGYGWSHNWDSGVELMTDTGMAFGSRHAADAVTALAAMIVLQDLSITVHGPLKEGSAYTGMMPDVANWALRCLVANWCVDSLKDNTAKVSMANRFLLFSNHNNGAEPFFPPPGVTDVLMKPNDATVTYKLTSRDLSVTEFKNVGSGANLRCALSRLVNPDGLAVTVTYINVTPNGMQVDFVKDTNNRGLNFDYTGGLLTKVSTLGDIAPRTVIFQYDNPTTTKNLILITDPAGRTTRHEYANPANHLMTGLRDGHGRVIATNDYDSQGRAIRQWAYGEAEKLWQYFYSDLRTVEMDPTGGRTTYYFDDQKRTIAKLNQVGDLRQTEYDFNNFPVRVIDAENQEVTTLYDEFLRPYHVNYPDGTFSTQGYDEYHRPTISISRGGRKTQLEYNEGNKKHRPDRVKVFQSANDPNPRTTRYTYHTVGKQVGQVATITDPAMRLTTLAYDSRGAPASATRQVEVDTGSGTQLLPMQTRTVFNARGDLTESFDERNIRTLTEYDASRKPTKVTRFLSSGTAYAVTTDYDKAGDAVQSFDNMPIPYRTGQTFSAQGKPLRSYRITQQGTFDTTLTGNNFASEQLYDVRDWPVQTDFLAPSDIPWKRVSATTVPYADGSPYQTTDPLRRTITFAKSPEQTTSSVTDDAGFRVITSTNVTTRQKLISDAFPSVAEAHPLALPGDVLRLSYQHAEDGELTSLTNRRSKTYSMDYNGYGQLESRTTHGNRTTTYTYTPDGQPETLTRPDNSVMSWSYYPKSGRLHTQTDPAGTIEHRYDVSGNLTWVRDQATGSTLSSAFDNVGRLQTFTDSRGQQTTYSWLPNGLLRSVRYHAQRSAARPATASTTIVNGAVETLTLGSGGMGYTGAPAVTFTAPPAASGGTTATAEAVVTDGVVTGLTITNAGSGYTTAPRVSIALPPPDLVVTYDYYPDRSLAKVTDWTGRATEFRYYQDGRLHSIKRPNGTTRAFAYTLAGELALVAESTLSNPTSPVIYLTKFAYNNRGQVREKSSFPGEPANATSTPPMTAVPGENNELVSVTVNGTAHTQVHDARGNLTRGVLPSGQMGTDATTYAFDARNRLMAMEGGHAFGYDVGNNRVSITTGGATTELSVAPLGGLSQVITEKPAGGAGAERIYIYTPQGQLLYHLDPNTSPEPQPGGLAASYYHYDITGSTVALSGDDGAVKGRVSYTPYGEITSKDADVDTRFLFCGAYGVQSDASGLIHMRARYYHPYLCRFLNEDPIEFSGGMNWFAYANGNPLNFVDPTGHFGLVGALIGAAVGVAIQGAADLWRGEASSWQTYAGAAVGGAVAGATAGLGSGALALAGAGAASGAASNVTRQVLTDPTTFDVGSLATETVTGAAFSYGAGKVIGAAANALPSGAKGVLGEWIAAIDVRTKGYQVIDDLGGLWTPMTRKGKVTAKGGRWEPDLWVQNELGEWLTVEVKTFNSRVMPNQQWGLDNYPSLDVIRYGLDWFESVGSVFGGAGSSAK